MEIVIEFLCYSFLFIIIIIIILALFALFYVFVECFLVIFFNVTIKDLIECVKNKIFNSDNKEIKKLQKENMELKMHNRKLQLELEQERELNRHMTSDGTLEPILQLVEYRPSAFNKKGKSNEKIDKKK